MEELETSDKESLAIAPLRKDMFIPNDKKKFIGRSVMIKQAMWMLCLLS